MPSYKDVILGTPGLVHYFRMSGGATDTDLGPGGATLTHNGSPVAASGLIKDPDGAKRYSGTTMDSTWSTAAFAGLNTMSLECWFREDSLVDWAHLVMNDDWPTCRLMILRNANTATLSAGWRDGVAGTDATATGAYKQLSINHMVATVDGTTLRLYINGLQVATAAMTGIFGSGSRTFRAGQAGSQQLVGVMDEVAAYNVALPAGTVARHYKAGVASGVLGGLLLPV